MAFDRNRFKHLVEKHARPRWDAEKDDWLLRSGGGEIYLQDKVLAKASPFLERSSLKKEPASNLIKAMSAHVNLLYAFDIMPAKVFLEQVSETELRDRFQDLLFGSEDLKSRFRNFSEWSKVRKIDGKQVGFNPLTSSYFLAISDPKKYPFCKPSVYNYAVETFQTAEETQNDPVERMLHCQQLYTELLVILENEYGLENGNLLDVHSLCFMFSFFESGADETKNYWQIAPGEAARLWDDFKHNSIVAVGWRELNAGLRGMSRGEIEKHYVKAYPEHNTRKRKIGLTQLWNFINLKPGDKIITNRGKSGLLGLAVVTGEYAFEPERTEYKHTVPVEYYKISDSGIPIPEKFRGKFGKTIVPLTPIFALVLTAISI